MKEYIIKLTKGKRAILTIPIDCTANEIRKILRELSNEVLAHCPHDETKFYDHNGVVRCVACGKIMN
jgi:flavoprotein